MVEECKSQVVSCNSKLLENAKKKKYVFPSSNKLLEDVQSFYFFDDQSHENIADIAGKYILASYSLEFLKLLNERIVKKYQIVQLTLSDFDNSTKVEEIKSYFEKLSNESFLSWAKNDCLEELRYSCDNVIVKNHIDLTKLGHIANLTLNELRDEENQDIDICDTHYRFQTRLNQFGIKTSDFISYYYFSKDEINEAYHRKTKVSEIKVDMTVRDKGYTRIKISGKETTNTVDFNPYLKEVPRIVGD